MLVVAGVSIAGIAPTWRGTLLGLGLQYVGVAILLFAMSGVVAGMVAIVTAVGIEALVAADQDITLRNDRWFANPLAGVRLDENDPRGTVRQRQARRPRRSATSTAALRVRLFDLSVIALAVVGALGVAFGRTTYGGFGADASVGVLILTGLLYCLLGGLPRLTSGLLFIGSAADLLLAESETRLAPVEMVLMPVGLIALTLALSFIRRQESQLAHLLGQLAAMPESVQADDPDLVTVDSGAST